MNVFCPSCGNKNDFAPNKKKGYCMRCGKEIDCSGLSGTVANEKNNPANSADKFAQIMNMTKSMSKMMENPGSLDMSGVVDMIQGMADSGLVDKSMVKDIESISGIAKNLENGIPFRTAPMSEQKLEDINAMMQNGKKRII